MTQLNIVCPHCFVTNRLPEARLADSPKCGKCHERLFTARPLPVNADQFRKMVSGNDIPVVVDYWAAWCGPCKMFAPIYEQAATTLEPHVRLLKLDTETCQDIAAQYRIQSILTLAVFKEGKELTRRSGAMPLGQFLDWIKQVA